MSSPLEEKRAYLRLLERKADKNSIKIATILDLPRLWSFGMVDWDDPAIADETNERKKILTEYNTIFWEVARLEHDGVNPRCDYAAIRCVTEFLNDLGEEDSCIFLFENHLTTHSFIEQVSGNPMFMDGLLYDDYMKYAEEVSA